MKHEQMFGRDDEGEVIDPADVTLHHLDQWSHKFLTAVCTSVSHNGEPGGELADYVLDPYYDPLYQVGDIYYLETMRNGQLTTARGGDELFSENDKDLLYYKKQFFREFIYQVLFETTTPYWREVMAESQLVDIGPGPQVLDGQKAMRYIISKFPENLAEYLETLCAKVLEKEFNIVGAEDPGPKFAEIAKIYKAIRKCPGVDPNEFGQPYYLRLIKMHLNANPHYHVPRESGWYLLSLAQDCYAANKVICDFYNANKTSWAAGGGAVAAATVHKPGASNGGGKRFKRGGKNGGRKSNGGGSNGGKIKCNNCGLEGHVNKDCRFENGGSAMQCFLCKREGREPSWGHDASRCKHKKSGGSGGGGGGGNRGDGGRNKKKNGGGGSINCTFCDKPGHTVKDCWTKYPEKAPNKRGKATSAAANGGGKRKAESEPKKSGKPKKKKSKNVKFGNQSYDSDSSMS